MENKKITYEEALAEMAINSHILCNEILKFDIEKEEAVYFKGKANCCEYKYIVTYADYKVLKKLEEAIEKAKRYDELTKDED